MKVSLHHLSADAAQVVPATRDQVLGELTPEQVGALLERFRAIDPVQNHEHDPHIAVQTTADKFIVRTSAGKLHLYDARNSSAAAIELDVAGLLGVFAGKPVVVAPAAEEIPDLPPPKRSRQMLGTALLALGATLNAWAIYVFLKPEPGDPVAAFTPVTDENELARVRDQLIGTYATGTGHDPGDRLIVVNADYTIQLQVIETTHALRNETMRGTLVRQEQHPAIALPGAGFITPRPDGTLLYFGDTYRPLARK